MTCETLVLTAWPLKLISTLKTVRDRSELDSRHGCYSLFLCRCCSFFLCPEGNHRRVCAAKSLAGHALALPDDGDGMPCHGPWLGRLLRWYGDPRVSETIS